VIVRRSCATWAAPSNPIQPGASAVLHICYQFQGHPQQRVPDSPVRCRGPGRATHIPVHVIEQTVTAAAGSREAEVFRLITTILFQ
jgi:hypothetical protein